jgi:ribosomal protein S18 acetylase RimI-like enzyme
VSAPARGTGVAAALIADAEQQLAASGVDVAWLACAVGNVRAARFYEKSGWRRARTVVSELVTPAGTIRLRVWRYEKALAPSPPRRRAASGRTPSPARHLRSRSRAS